MKTIIIYNSQTEMIATSYDISDKKYIEPIIAELR